MTVLLVGPTFNFHLQPVSSAVDVLHIVVVVDEQRGGIRSVKHPVLRTLLREEKANKNEMKRVKSALTESGRESRI